MDPLNVPTVGGDLDQLQQQVSSIVSKIEKVPFDKLGEDLQATLSSTAQLMRRLDRDSVPQAKSMLGEAQQSFAQVNALLASDSPLPINAGWPCRK
jgi:paraquat-inducible protein B